ncbi:MAG: type II toxin-antitoxin system prevent-host-death family antitoxin [Candidatus Poribacteria bacterium]
MKREISAVEARQRLGQLLDDVCASDGTYIVKRANTPMVAVMSIERYERLTQQERYERFDVLRPIWYDMPVTSDADAERDVEAAILGSARAEAPKVGMGTVLDTNQFVRAHIRGDGLQAQLIHRWRREAFELVTSLCAP